LLLVKATADGCGTGVSMFDDAAGFDKGLVGDKSEAAAAFGDDRVLLEKYLTRPRHVEVQVFADTQGSVLYLFERDCSIQRRHQKVVEEAPAPGLAPHQRRAIGQAAVAAAAAIGYVGAGTVEFLMDEDGAFYFMEMNTRLQVEHPVTEMITGLDLVEWQVRVAGGEPLPMGQDDLAIDGHAIEVRLYAEDPQGGFLPATGTLHHLRLPADDVHVRVDTGVRQGDALTVHYDPMIAKLIVHDRDRAAAIRRLRTALDRTEVVGVATNTGFLQAIAAHPAFAAADLDTRFIDRHTADLLPDPGLPGGPVLAAAVLGLLLGRRRDAEAASRLSRDPWSPWNAADGWRLNDEATETLALRHAGTVLEMSVRYLRDGTFRILLPDGATVHATGEIDADSTLHAVLDGVRGRVTLVRRGREITVLGHAATGTHHFTLVDPIAEAESAGADAGRLTSPMPGRIVAVLAEAGQEVTAGTPLVILEAMKMEHTLRAPADGRVTDVPYAVGDQVEDGVPLIGFEPA
ncbi:MAG: 3-methylcrotonyl-CoA carboxylase, partial [Rhodospirillaceae bacterium]|nr:3-methylcrotonyl-CoA carboxylase [Rhodospirillaceae bacterium]